MKVGESAGSIKISLPSTPPACTDQVSVNFTVASTPAQLIRSSLREAMKPVLVVGGYGTFGAKVCEELCRRSVPFTVAGRDARKARWFARRLGHACRAVSLDALNAAACRQALQGHG